VRGVGKVRMDTALTKNTQRAWRIRVSMAENGQSFTAAMFALALERAEAGKNPAQAPRQLPPEVRPFIGREKELEQAADAEGTIVMRGPAGVGKTALATQLAHEVLERFPGGQTGSCSSTFAATTAHRSSMRPRPWNRCCGALTRPAAFDSLDVLGQ
jgi:hypothetical protein